MELMKAFYRDLFPFPIRGDGETGLGFETGATQFSLRKRTRHYDGQGTRNDLPGVQIAFRVEPDEVQEEQEACAVHIHNMGFGIHVDIRSHDAPFIDTSIVVSGNDMHFQVFILPAQPFEIRVITELPIK
jgi:hypothetical protein